MPFGDVGDLDLPALETRVLAHWRDQDVVERVAKHRKDGPRWIFYEGPPTANGRPGLHHVWARAFKDLYPRFQTMRGKSVPRKGGWDCHGLPVELEVEKELGLSTKHEIEAYGVAEFNRRCRESVQRYVEDWSSLTSRSGTWIDTEDAYWTLSNDYIESVWWIVRQLWDRELLYEGHRVTPYCGRCGTALSSHEVAQGYADVVDPSVYVRFPLADDDADLLVWTTTPWTLVSNVATAVGPDIEYARLATAGRDLVLGAAAADRLFPDAEVRERFRGVDLVGRRYVRPFDVLDLDGRGEQVFGADFVSTDDGSGIVHLAPAFGEDDARIGRDHDLPVLNPVDEDATFDASVPAFTGRFVKGADRDIIDDLAARGLLVAEEEYEHSYPHCWRCGTPLIYWAKTSWFARTAHERPALLRENDRIGWHPEHLKHGRFGKWLEGNVDWALSRDRYWGTPLPIWRCEDGHDTCIGSVAELAERTGRDLDSLDLHRPYVDEVTFDCPTCRAPARRLPPVLDAWFDSGSMPSAQHHHPFDPDGRFETTFPADFICEAIDQTRGWFYSLLAVNTLVFDETPYRNVVCLGLLVDQDGAKMSKSKGNVIDPWTVFDDHGADALRWYFFSSGQPWTTRRVFDDGIREAAGQTLVTVWNVFRFFCTYADLERWEPAAAPRPAHVLDRWLLGRLDETIRSMTDALDAFDALGAATDLAVFIDDLSNWYLRRSRPRFWKSRDDDAFATLHHALVVTSQLLAPFCPFLADELYTRLTDHDSVHLSDWPEPGGHHDAPLAAEMAAARRLVVLGRAARTDAKIKVRQPLRRALVLHPGPTPSDAVLAQVRDELNVHLVEAVSSLEGLMDWTVVPNFRTLGPRLGPKVNEVKAALAEADGASLERRLREAGHVVVAGEQLGPDDVEVRAARHESFALAEDGGWAVALDLEIDAELRREGLARELIRVVNDLRKSNDLAISDRIRLTIAGDETIESVLDDHAGSISEETLTTELRRADGADELALDGHSVRVGVERV